MTAVTIHGVAMRLHGPLQSWGGPTIGDDRPTLPFPTRSAVLGVIAACMGIRRDEDERLFALARNARVHVRVDLAGTPLVDDQTIQDNPNASPTRQTIQSKRTYLCDASFVAVVVPGDRATTSEIAAALVEPVFAPFLGRRTCVPASPLLAAADVSGQEPLDLFAGIPRGPEELVAQLRRSSGRSADVFDYYLDVDDHPSIIRRIPIRDDLTGPLPRQWRERFAAHVRSRANARAGA